jgi:hypothetical protein
MKKPFRILRDRWDDNIKVALEDLECEIVD